MSDALGHRGVPPDEPRDAATEFDVRIGRILDGEADERDLDAFGRDAAHWRLLAQRVHEQAQLRSAFEEELAGAQNVGLPRRALTTSLRRAGSVAGVLGWAAAIALAFAIGIGAFETDDARRYRSIDLQKIQTHIDQILKQNEIDPLAIRTEELPDGRFRITWMRRILEVIETDEFRPEWIRDGADALPEPNEM